MTSTEHEIASAAARRSAGMRRRVTATCPVCGASFEGLTTRRYCSDRCRSRAARQEATVNEYTEEQLPVELPFGRVLTDEEMEPRPGENIADLFVRVRRTMFRNQVFDSDVVEDLRREDELQSDHVYHLSHGR